MLIRAADYPVSPWKNGGGTTREIAAKPAQAGTADFTWRISMATVTTDGPFSQFEGIDRTLVLLTGAGMDLQFEAGETVHLTAGNMLAHFDGDAPLIATLVAGPITDLNIMTRRDKLHHHVEIHRVDGAFQINRARYTRALICLDGGLELDQGNGALALGTYDCLLLKAGAKGVTLRGIGALIQVDFLT